MMLSLSEGNGGAHEFQSRFLLMPERDEIEDVSSAGLSATITRTNQYQKASWWKLDELNWWASRRYTKLPHGAM